ncbi:unnamed protein product [Rhodiola kirilowii]
MDMARD